MAGIATVKRGTGGHCYCEKRQWWASLIQKEAVSDIAPVKRDRVAGIATTKRDSGGHRFCEKRQWWASLIQKEAVSDIAPVKRGNGGHRYCEKRQWRASLIQKETVADIRKFNKQMRRKFSQDHQEILDSRFLVYHPTMATDFSLHFNEIFSTKKYLNQNFRLCYSLFKF